MLYVHEPTGIGMMGSLSRKLYMLSQVVIYYHNFTDLVGIDSIINYYREAW